jgi:hypothetical protein
MIEIRGNKIVTVNGQDINALSSALVACFHNNDNKWYQIGTIKHYPKLIETATEAAVTASENELFNYGINDLLREIKNSGLFDENTILYIVDFKTRKIHCNVTSTQHTARNHLYRYGFNVYESGEWEGINCSSTLNSIAISKHESYET